MKKLILLLTVCCLLFPTKKTVAAENPVQSWGQTENAKATTVVRVPDESKELKPCKLRQGLSRKDRRQVGATFSNVKRILGELQSEDPKSFEESSAEELAIDVATRLVAENPQAFQNLERDWAEFFELLIAFLEKIIPLIISIITIFS